MKNSVSRWLSVAAVLAAFALALPARAADATTDLERTPPRLSFTDGEVSFWRNGADDWSAAQVNTPLAAGDQLYAGDKANLEVQIGARAFARAGEQTQLGVANLEPDFLQLRIVTGHASLDLRSLSAGMTVEVDTPHAAFTVEHPGYYRIEVTDENTRFTSRRGGRATVTPANGHSGAVAASEMVVVSGGDEPRLETYSAAELDDWDRWNYTRTDQQIDAVSQRYVPNGVYGVDDLDHYGDWRVVPSYGAVWMPRVATGWVPYSTGSWVYDPYYGWTWVDTAPWGWAPFHYGRWVSVGGYWGWAPGPLVARAYYSPALVAFYGSPSFSIGIGFGTASYGWVALGWGEPCLPWWGSSHFRGHPHWRGWGGPRVVNNVVINKTTVVNVNDIRRWENAGRKGAVVGVPRDQFGRGRVNVQHFDSERVAKLRPMRGDLDAKPRASSLSPSVDRGRRPPRSFEREVVATREARRDAPANLRRSTAPAREDVSAPKPGRLFGRDKSQVTREQGQAREERVVTPPKRGDSQSLRNRPPFGTQSSAERSAPPKPPRFGDSRGRTERAPQAAREARPSPTREARPDAREVTPPSQPRQREPRVAEPRAERPRREATAPAPAPRNLPGEPANRVFRGHGENQPRAEAPQRVTPQRQESPRAQQQQQQPRGSERNRGQDGQPPAAAEGGRSGGGESRGGGGFGRGRGDRGR